MAPVEAEGLVKVYSSRKSEVRALDGVDLEVREGHGARPLFAYVFGGAIPLPGGGSYREHLMPGIYIQTLGFASITTAIAVTDDMAKGLIDRFRSLPMARSAVLSGRTFSDVVYNVGILVVLMVSGLFVG